MLKARAINNLKSQISGKIKTLSGESLDYCEVISDGIRVSVNYYDASSNEDISIKDYDDIFGKIGYTGSEQWRIWRHYIHHIVRF